MDPLMAISLRSQTRSGSFVMMVLFLWVLRSGLVRKTARGVEMRRFAKVNIIEAISSSFLLRYLRVMCFQVNYFLLTAASRAYHDNCVYSCGLWSSPSTHEWGVVWWPHSVPQLCVFSLRSWVRSPRIIWKGLPGQCNMKWIFKCLRGSDASGSLKIWHISFEK